MPTPRARVPPPPGGGGGGLLHGKASCAECQHGSTSTDYPELCYLVSIKVGVKYSCNRHQVSSVAVLWPYCVGSVQPVRLTLSLPDAASHGAQVGTTGTRNAQPLPKRQPSPCCARRRKRLAVGSLATCCSHACSSAAHPSTYSHAQSAPSACARRRAASTAVHPPVGEHLSC